MFEKVLIANRGEIALRVVRTCRRMGIRTVAVYSEVDARCLHVREADEAVCLGPAPAQQSYLAKEKVIDAALRTGCQAIHPGYGFLSENPAFADMTARAGLAFVGPPGPVIAILGDKIASKALARRAGVPVVPGHAQALADPAEALRVADEIGYPLLVKPAAGGGGRGMRIVESRDALAEAMHRGQEETRKAFDDTRVFLERYIPRPRHIEVQVLADAHGRVLYLGERECSVQRRFQKVLEESPSPAVDAETRRRLGEMACAVAREAGYVNAGTAEFIRDPDGQFYFLEMNTRLQVEHTVTEMVTSLDLVELQLRVAAGDPLPLRQDDVRLEGWAVEARVCAEDPLRDFLPSTGILTRYAEPRGPRVRVDSGVEAGSSIGVYYDSLLAKVIGWGPTRDEAVRTLIHALNRFHLEGVTTNLHFCNAVLNHPAFLAGDLSTDFIERHSAGGEVTAPPTAENLLAMSMAALLVYHNRENLVRDSLKPMAARSGQTHGPAPAHRYVVKGGDDVFELELRSGGQPRHWQVQAGGRSYDVVTPVFEFYRRRLKLTIDGSDRYFQLQYRGNFLWVAFCGITRAFEVYTPKEWQLARLMPEPAQAQAENALLSPMPGLVVGVRVAAGDRVYRGQDLVTIESMKMESGVASPVDRVVDEVRARAGQAVETGDVLLTFKG